jgi:transposase-like protein
MGKRGPPKPDKGQRRKIPFDAGQRAKFIESVRRGASISQACRMNGISRDTVATWLKSGRSETPGHPEHRRFAQDYDKASTEGIVEVIEHLKKQSSETDGKGTKAALAMLAALDPRFGDRHLKKRAMELSNERTELEIRMTKVRVEVAEAAARGDSSVPGFGLASLLGDEDLPVEVRQTVAAWAVRRGFVAVERKDWAA